jgi:hypothetical protein
MINYFQNYFELKVLKLTDIKLHEATESGKKNKSIRQDFRSKIYK